MANLSTVSFPTNRWTDSDYLSNLDAAFASIDAALRYFFGRDTDALTAAPFSITDAGAVTLPVSLAIGTSNDIDDIVDSIPASPGASEDTELATVQAIRNFIVSGGGSADIQIDEVPVDSDDYSGALSGIENTLAAALSALDSHGHTESDITDLGSYLEADDVYDALFPLENGSVVSGKEVDGTARNLVYVTSSDVAAVGDIYIPLELRGNGTRPTYADSIGAGVELALLSDTGGSSSDVPHLSSGDAESIKLCLAPLNITALDGSETVTISARSFIQSIEHGAVSPIYDPPYFDIQREGGSWGGWDTDPSNISVSFDLSGADLGGGTFVVNVFVTEGNSSNVAQTSITILDSSGMPADPPAPA